MRKFEFSINNRIFFFDFIKELVNEQRTKSKFHTYRFTNIATSIIRKDLRNITRYL